MDHEKLILSDHVLADRVQQNTEQIEKLERDVAELKTSEIERSVRDEHREERFYSIEKRFCGMEAKIDHLTGRVETLILKPGDDWEKLRWIMVSLMLGALIPWIIQHFIH